LRTGSPYCRIGNPPQFYWSVGSTVTRSRPAGRGVAASASQSVRWSGARTSHRPSPRSAAIPPAIPPSAAQYAAAASPLTTARAANGGRSSSSRNGRSSTRPGSPATAAASTGWSGSLVWTSTGPAPAAAADEPAGPGEQGQRLLRRGEPGGEQVLVEVQEDDRGGPPDPVEDRLGPDEHRRLRDRVAGVARDLADVDTEQRGQLLSDPRHAGPQHLQPRAAARGADDRPGRPATAAPQAVVVLFDRPATRRAAGDLAARRAGQQPGPAGPVEHADQRRPHR
jgi:hypothetical protein